MNIEFRQNDCKSVEGGRMRECDTNLWKMVKWCYDTVNFSEKKNRNEKKRK